MTDRIDSHRWSRASAFGLGLFTIGAQTALLREYLVLFRGNELAIGFFFACWFIWVATGATLVRRAEHLRRFVFDRVAGLLALHPACALLGLLALVSVRHLLGVPPYEPMPPVGLFLGAFVASAPVSLVTGLLFPALCDRSGPDERSGASTGYVAESAGAFLGGVLATLAFLGGMDGVQVTAALGLFPVALSFGKMVQTRRRTFGVLAFVCSLPLLAVLIPPAGPAIRNWIADVRLDANLLEGELIEERHTPYQLLTVARLPDQEVVLANGAIESVFPPGPGAEGEAALLAAQPTFRNRAVILGQGASPLAWTLRRYFSRVTIVSVDSAATEILGEDRPIPPGYSGSPEFLTDDPRRFVRRDHGLEADLVVLATPEPGTLLANRMYTREFFEDLRNSLSPGGLVAVPVRSAENYLGTEFLRYGQSVWQTLGTVFPELAIIPGDTALILASMTPHRLSVDPTELARRYEEFAPRPQPYPAEGFSTLVRPDRAESTRAAYGSDKTPGDLVNLDDRPLAAFLFLLTMLKQSESPGTRLLWSIHEAGWWLPWVVLVILFLVILRYRIRQGPKPAGFATAITMVVVGFASISASVALLASFQSSLGAVYGEVGAATGLVMAGLGIGAALSARLTRGISTDRVRRCSIAFICFAGALFLAVPVALEAIPSSGPLAARVLFGALFLGSGVLTGAAWPLAAAMADRGGIAARMESSDHWGAALGAGMTGVFVMSVFGLDTTFHLIAGLFGLVALSLILDTLLRSEAGTSWFDSRSGMFLSFRSFPFSASSAVLLFVSLSALVMFHGADTSESGMVTRFDPEAIRRHESFSSQSFESDPFHHHRLEGVVEPSGNAVLVATQAVVPAVKGYGGPMNLLLSVGSDGIIRRTAVLAHNETPSYVTGLPSFLHDFVGSDVRRILDASSRKAVDAMTGATVTRNAVLQTLDGTREAVATELLGLPAEGTAEPDSWYRSLAHPESIYVALFLVAAVFVHLRGGPMARLVFLLTSLVIGGWVFNIQLSASWLLALFRWELPSFGANTPLFLLTLGVLGLSILFGPLYCAHICPFGALQEILGRLSKRLGIRTLPPADLSDRARGIKYLLLSLVVLSLFSRDPSSAVGWDPLGAVFSGRFEGVAWVLVALALGGSLLFFRFWCRVFCPVGAFFLLFNRIAGFLGLGPARHYPLCDLGVKGPADIECLQCNRCLREPPMTVER